MFTIFRGGIAAVVWTLLVGIQNLATAQTPEPGLERFYVGTYSGRIYVSSLNLGTESFGAISNAVTTTDPSFLAFSRNREFVYSVNEGPGTVSAFSVNQTNGTLKLLNSRSSSGGAPAHIVVDASGKNVLVANYNGGSVVVFPIQSDGKLGISTSKVQHPAGANAHCVTMDAANRFAFVCDKGLNQVRSYLFDPAAGTLTTNTTLITPLTKGSGPRHMAYEPEYKRAYVICELSSTVVGFNYDATNGILTPFQTNSTLPSGGFGGNTTAEIVVHPSGKFVYGSNRGHNTIVVYSVNAADGTLTLIQHQKTGATPRSFAIDPTGAFCIVAGQNSNDIRLYTIDQQTGLLTDTGKKLTASSPVCILPFLLRPPQPAITLTASGNALELNLGNALNMLTYQLYRSPSLNFGTNWTVLTTGAPGQTNFMLPKSLEPEFFQAGVLTNY